MTIREFAKSKNVTVVGKLTRRPDWEFSTNLYGVQKKDVHRAYSDEALNEYYVFPDGNFTIVTCDGGVI